MADRMCPNCSMLSGDDGQWCQRCGSDLVPVNPGIVAGCRAVVVERLRVNCVCYGTRLRHDPITDTMTEIFSCSRTLDRIDCVGCQVCTTCGEMNCTCGFLGISIEVKIKSTVIETVPVRPRLKP